MIDAHDEYEEYEKHLLRDKRIHLDLVKRWHDMDDNVDGFIRKRGPAVFSFLFGFLSAISALTGLYLSTFDKPFLIILGRICTVVSIFVFPFFAYIANRNFKKRLSRNIFFTFCFPQMIKDAVLDEKEREITQTKYKVRDLVLDIQWFTEHISECDPKDKDKYSNILKHLTVSTEKLSSITSSELTHNYDRLSKDLQDSWPIMDAVDKTYQKN